MVRKVQEGKKMNGFSGSSGLRVELLMFENEGRAKRELLYQVGVMRIGLGVKMKQRRAPTLDAPLFV